MIRLRVCLYLGRTAAFTLCQAFLAISQPRVIRIAVAFLDALVARSNTPQTLCHAPHGWDACWAVGLEAFSNAVAAIARVTRTACQRRQSHFRCDDQQQQHEQPSPSHFRHLTLT